MPGMLNLIVQRESENNFFLNYAISDYDQNVYLTLSDKENVYNLHQLLRSAIPLLNPSVEEPSQFLSTCVRH